MKLPEKYVNRLHKVSIVGLRIAIGAIFLWFGMLKLTGHNPVFDILNGIFPFLAAGIGIQLLGAFEALLGLGLLFNVFPLFVNVVLIGHLTVTFLTFFTTPELMFDPHFPVLTMEGEFVFKNIVLILGGLVVLAHEQQRA
jgi:uncharacterized membrane protein YkgB